MISALNRGSFGPSSKSPIRSGGFCAGERSQRELFVLAGPSNSGVNSAGACSGEREMLTGGKATLGSVRGALWLVKNGNVSYVRIEVPSTEYGILSTDHCQLLYAPNAA